MLNKMHFAAGEIPEKAVKRIEGRFDLEPEERVILFYNLGLLRYGAAGVVFTDRRVIRYDTKKVAFHPNEEIRSVSFENLHKMNGTAYLTVRDEKTPLGIFESKDFKEVEALLSPYVPVEGEGIASEQELQERARVLEAFSGLPAARLTLDVPVRIATGKGYVARKIAWGVVTRGLGAATRSRFSMDAVRLPEECCLCGVLKGRKLRGTEFTFRPGTTWGAVFGINAEATMQMLYRVCAPCAKLPGDALEMTDFRKSGETWLLTLSVRNPDIARRIGEMNVVVPDVIQ